MVLFPPYLFSKFFKKFIFLSRVEWQILTIIFLIRRVYIYAICENTYNDISISLGLLFDAFMAEHYLKIKIEDQLKSGNDIHFLSETEEGFLLFNKKIIIIVSRNYFKFHGLTETNGLVLSPIITTKEKKKVGSWNAAFVADEVLEDKLAKEKGEPQGIVLHEVAHFLEQGKEYYAIRDKNDNPLPDSAKAFLQISRKSKTALL